MDRRTSTPGQLAGDQAETLVAERLEASGWAILARNLRVGRSELDIVAIDPGPPPTMTVVEVRMRNRRDFGLAEETLDRRKRAALRRGVGALLERGALPDGMRLPSLPVRIDLVAVERMPDGGIAIRHHRGIRP